MEYLTTDKEGIKILIEVLKEKGIRQVVLSPGSRNAPLLVAFAREKQIRHFVVLDERSAAFMALGMAQQSGVPVALVCTSGTAPLNYAPAIAEAYYQRLPLIVITADRPVEWIDQDDSQTIRQQAVFRNIVKASYQLPAELFHADEHWYANRLVNDALNTALKGRQGPVHLNIPLRESLYGLRDYPEREVRTIECIDPAPSLSAGVMQRLVDIFDHCPKVMILAGFHRPDFRLREALHRLAGYPNVVVLTETLANVTSERHIGTIDRVLATVKEAEREEYRPELLITFGGPLISRHVKAYLRKFRPRWHWSIDRTEHPADTMQVLTTQIQLEAEGFFPQLVAVAKGRASDYALRWKEKKESAAVRHEEFAGRVEWSDWKAFSLILPALPEGSALQLANSTPVRYGQLFDYFQVKRVDGNRGTSGIDGSTSTAVGTALMREGITTLITGDMSFLYDSNALWNKYISSRLKIIVMKNGGGGIFRFISGPSELEELEECFETGTEVDVCGFAQLHHFRYFKASDEVELAGVLPEFFNETEWPVILEVETPRLKNAEVLKSYFRSLQGE